MTNIFKSDMNIANRFDNQNGYAAWSLGCPSMLHATNKKEFQKNVNEIGKLYTLKKQVPKTRNHKFVTYLKVSF